MSRSSATISELVPSFRRSLRAKNRADNTIKNYEGAARTFVAWLTDEGLSESVVSVEQQHVERFIGHQLDTRSSSTAASRYRCLQQFFRWAAREGEVEHSPMANMEPPSVEEKVPAVLSDDELRRLLAACDGKDFSQRRDNALIRLLLDSGLRAGETVGIDVGDLDLDGQVVHVVGKGAKGRLCPFGRKTAEALDRYERARRQHKHSAEPALWLALRGPMTQSGLSQMLRKRGASVGIDGLHPHKFRHTFAHRWLANEGNEGDLQLIAGWSSRQMLDRYGASAKAERARDAHRRLGLGDLL